MALVVSLYKMHIGGTMELNELSVLVTDDILNWSDLAIIAFSRTFLVPGTGY